MNIASEALMHSPDNNTSPAQNYTIVNYRPRGYLTIRQSHSKSLTKTNHMAVHPGKLAEKFSQPSREKLRKKRTMAETTRSVSLNVLVISTEPENITKQSIITLKILLTTKLTN
ncbi:uncharacterized protein OCT59_029854 [Rhizophagus irregularis]|nr:hypothetical protein OCT59_029854 [Rhizophagus irregularis]